MNNHIFTTKCQDDKPISQHVLEHNANFDQYFSVKGIYKLPKD